MTSLMSLDIYDTRPEGMTNYLRYYGWHFNKKMCDWAVSMMTKGGKAITPITKELAENMKSLYGITINAESIYDVVYLLNLGKADYLSSSIPDEMHLVRYAKDVVEDEDGYNGMPFSHFYINTVKKGIPINWDDML